MSIEATLNSIAESLVKIAAALTAQPVETVKSAKTPKPEKPAPVQAAPAPVEMIAPVIAAEPEVPVLAAMTSMPAAPFPEVVESCPITDQASLRQYVIGSFNKLGNAGTEIQGIISSCGVQSLNDIPADKYAFVFNGIEALLKKAGL